MALLLRDPESATYKRVGGPVPGAAMRVIVGGLVPATPVTGWAYCYLYNAKGWSGGYVGYQPLYVVFDDGKLVGVADLSRMGTWNCF